MSITTTIVEEWFVWRGRSQHIYGPFPAREVARFLTLGRIHPTDRVSTDGELWELVSEVPQLVPDSMLSLDEPAWLPPVADVPDHDDRPSLTVQAAMVCVGIFGSGVIWGALLM